MKLLADLHISPGTVTHLISLGYDVVRVSSIMPANSSDKSIIERAVQDGRIILTQDLDFSQLIALSDEDRPSLITLRFSSSRIEYVNKRLETTLPQIVDDINKGAMVTIEDKNIRTRFFA